MIRETENYLKYRTICPIPYDCLSQSNLLEKQNIVVRNKEVIQNTVVINEISPEKKVAIGQLVTVLQKAATKQQVQQRELIFMLKNLNETKNTRASVHHEISQVSVEKEETAEEKLRKAENRVRELETLLKQMEDEKKQSADKSAQNIVTTQNGKSVTTKDVEKQNITSNKEDKKSELLNKVLKSTQDIIVDVQIQRQNQGKIAALKKPYIAKKGVMFKKVTVIWNTIYFGSYPQIKETLLKNRMETDALRDEKGNYIYGSGQYARKFRKTIREYYEYQPIRWRVLDINNGIVTLFADQILDAMPYHDIPMGVISWEKSFLCRWLNEEFEGSFYQLAFSEEEKAAIVHKPARQDKVTLLRHIEISDKSYESYGFYDLYQKRYLSIEGLKPNGYTDYAEGKAIFKKETFNGRTGAWWLKDIVGNGEKALEVNVSGYIGTQGTNMDVKWVGVRPIIVVDLNKLNIAIKTGNPVEVVSG